MKKRNLDENRIRFSPGSFKAAVKSILIFLLLATVIIIAGILYYRNYEKDYRSEAGHQLLTIAELKVSELTQYRRERLADGRVFFRNPVFSRMVRRLLNQPDDLDTKQQLETWLGKTQEHYKYSRIFLADTQAVERLVVPVGSKPIDDIAGHVAETLRSGQVTFLDFHRHAPDRSAYLCVLVPVYDEVATNNLLGALILQIDPSTYLYPFLQRWPVPSKTAETLLVRREGNEVVFLNQLRFRPDAALMLRHPLTRTDLPAAKAVLGKEAVVEGRDYRNIPVLAAVHPVPDSPWFMVAREDKSEVFAPMRSQFWQVIIMIAVLMFGTGAGIGLVWRQQRVQFFREKAATAEALRQTNDYLENLINHANAPIVVWDPQFHITRFNSAFEQLTGRREEDVIGQSLDILFPPERAKEAMVLIHKTMEGEQWEEAEIPVLHVNGSTRTVLWNSAIVHAADGKTSVATIAQGHDITARKRFEQQLEDTMENLRVSNRDLEQFAYVASHDLQEPLRMISNYVQLLERRYKDQLDQDAKDFIGYAVDGAVRMQQLIDSLLEYSRLQTRKRPFEAVDLNRTLDRVLHDLEGRILETGVRITVDRLPQVLGDSVQLGLVFQNLVSNAIKFRSKKDPWIHILANEFSGYWKITVSDNGIGIEPEHRERIFKIFQRLHSRADYPGTGIGLAICRRIIERHSGEIDVKSALGEGSSFWFTLPKKGENNHGAGQSNRNSAG